MKTSRGYISNEENMLILFEAMIKGLRKYFNLEITSNFTLWFDYIDDELVDESEKLDLKSFLNNIKKMRAAFKRKGKSESPHFTIYCEGIIELKYENKFENMVVDITGTCSDFNKTYGNVWVNFYNTNKKWYNYFVGIKEPSLENNRNKIISLIKDLTLPDFNIYSIYFAKENIVFDVLNKAFLIYFKKFRFFLQELIEIIKSRISVKDLDYEELLLTDLKRPDLTTIQNDLRLYSKEEIISILDKHAPEINKSSIDLLTNYKTAIISTENSVMITDKYFNPTIVRYLTTDFIGNFLDILNNSLPRYAEIEERFDKVISGHIFKPEHKVKTKKMDKFFGDSN